MIQRQIVQWYYKIFLAEFPYIQKCFQKLHIFINIISHNTISLTRNFYLTIGVWYNINFISNIAMLFSILLVCKYIEQQICIRLLISLFYSKLLPYFNLWNKSLIRYEVFGNDFMNASCWAFPTFRIEVIVYCPF